MPFAFRQSLESQDLRYIRPAADSDPIRAPTGYTAIYSQTMLPRSCSPIACEISVPLSQNCAARVTEILARVAVEGDDQSVNNTGSQTTKVRTCLPARSAKM